MIDLALDGLCAASLAIVAVYIAARACDLIDILSLTLLG